MRITGPEQWGAIAGSEQGRDLKRAGLWFSKILAGGKGQIQGRKPGMSVDMKDEVGEGGQGGSWARVRRRRNEHT